MTVPIRRFEPSANTSYLTDFLAQCGYDVTAHAGRFKINGRWKTRAKALEVVDAERIKRGLEPIVLRKKKK